MGDVISSHLDESKREIISARTGAVTAEFVRLYEQQHAVALFNTVRFDIEGGVGPQAQLLHRKTPHENKSIFSGSLFQYLEENKKWRNRFFFVPDSYNINYYDNKSSHDRGLQPKGTINCAGYKVLTSMEPYLELISNSLPGVKAKVGSSPFLKCPSQFPLILWHPYARHYYFCVTTEKEQEKWRAVLQDCVRHANDGLSEENKVQTPAFTDAVRLYRQAQGHYGTWEMMCGDSSQILSNLVMDGLIPELRELISPRLKGKLHERQRNWMLISDAVYSLVQGQCRTQYEAVVKKCEAARPSLESSIRTDMDQIITSKEHVTNKIKAAVLQKAEKLLKVSIQPYIGSILDALMEPTSRGFSEVRDVFFRELVDMSKNTLNDGTKETMAQHMEKISMLAFHPVKMNSCYEKVEHLSLEGLQQRFDVSSPSVFVQRAQILMREQMDNAVYTFEQILHQSLESQGAEELCKTIQRCQDRVIKKFDYDSSTVRKRFFREALLQIFIPYMLKQLGPACGSELPRFQELIFEDFSRFILVENIFEEVVLHSVMKDIMMAVKEAAVQRRHNLYRDSIVLSNSDPSLHLLGENPSIDWAKEHGGGAQEEEEEADGSGDDAEVDADGETQKTRRMKQVVSMIQVEDSTALPESCNDDIPEVDEGEDEEEKEENNAESAPPKSPSEDAAALSNSSVLKAEGEAAKPEGHIQEIPCVIESESVPSATESVPATSESVPTAPESVPTAPESVPTASESVPATQESSPTAPESVPAAPESVPAGTESVPATPESVPASPESVLVTPESVPAAPESLSAAPESVSAAPESVSAAPESVPAATESVPAYPESVSASPPSVPASPESVPASPAGVPASPESVPASPESVPAVPESVPAVPESVPAVPESVPAATESVSASEGKDEGAHGQPGPEAAKEQEESEEALPPAPPPVDEILSDDALTPPEVTADFPPPPHDDSGFQSPSSEGAEPEEEEEAATSQPTKEQAEETSTIAAQEAEAKPTDSEKKEP